MVTNEWQLAKYYRIRMEILIHLGNKCVKCESTTDLEIDHIEPSSKSFDISRNFTMSKPKLYDELNKCQLLCNHCHLEKSLLEQRTPNHGTWGMYKRGCRCNDCKTFVSSYMREYKRSRRR